MAAAGRDGPLAPHMRPGAPCRRVKCMGDNPPSLRVYFLVGLRVFMDLKALLCSGNDESPQHRSVWGTINALNSPKSYIRLLGGLSPIHSTRWRGAKGLVWGARGPFPPAAAMVGYDCDGWCWPLEAYIRSTNCRNSKKFLLKYFFYSYVNPIQSWHLTRQLNKEESDLRTLLFSWFLCPVLYGRPLWTQREFSRGGDIFRSEKKCSNWSNSAVVRLVHVSGYSDRSHLADPGIIYLFSQK
jgi:hypothetical protein